MTVPLGKEIPLPTGRRFVIADIHGCIDTLKALLSNLDLTITDQIFLLGDYVNKGKSGRLVLDEIIHLSKRFEVFPILGNHDLMLLESLESTNSNLVEQLQALNSSEFFDLPIKEKKYYVDFLSDLRKFYITGNFILVHAGFNFELKEPFCDAHSMLNIRSFDYNDKKAENRTIVHGHLPIRFESIIESVTESSKIIGIDNGCVYAGQREGMGRLICLELNTMELFYSENVD